MFIPLIRALYELHMGSFLHSSNGLHQNFAASGNSAKRLPRPHQTNFRVFCVLQKQEVQKTHNISRMQENGMLKYD